MTDKEWLAGLKAGDVVVVARGYVHQDYRLAKVERVTATQVVMPHSRFNKSDGRMRGSDGYTPVRLMKPTPELIEKIERAGCISELTGLHNRRQYLETLPTQTLLAATAILFSSKAS